MKLKFNIIVLALLFLLGFISATFAADVIEVEELTPSEVLMQEVAIIGSKFNLKDIAGSAAFLSVEDIREHGVADVNRLLRRVPGVNLRQEDGFGLFPNISLRGVDPARNSKITVMEDGVLSAPAPYSAPSAYYSPTTARMSGVEVLKGSSQVKYGPHTTGGAINFLSTPIPTTEKYYLKSSWGSFNEMRSHAYFGNQEITKYGKIGYLIEYFDRGNNGFKELDNNFGYRSNRGEADTGFRKSEPMLKMSFEPKSNMYQRFELKMGYTNLDANETYTGINDDDFRQTPNRRYAGSRFDEIESTHTRNYLRHFLEISKDTNLVTTAYGNTFSRNWQKLDKVGGVDISRAIMDMSAGGGYDIINGEAAGTLKVKDNNRTYYLYGIQSNLTHKLKWGETDHKIDIGIRYHYDQIRRLQASDTYTQDANGYITSATSTMYGKDGNRLQYTHATSLNISDQIKFKKLTFTPGIRAENIDATYIKYNEDDNGDHIQKITTHTGQNYGMIAGGASLKMDVYDEGGQDFDLFGSINRGVSPPSPSGSAKDGLREETSVGYELGMRYADAPKAFSTELIFFLTNISDLIIPDSIGGAGAGATQQAGDVRTRGVELAVNYDHGLRKGWAFQTPMYISATYTDATFTDAAVTSDDEESIWIGAKNGNELPYITPEVFSFGVGMIYQKFNINFDGNYNGDTFADGSNQSAQVNPVSNNADARFGKIDSYFVLDAALGWQFNKNVRMFSNFKNITNQDYMVSRQPLGPRPGLPFSMMAGLEFSL
ncbi:MAG: TonB-dependent receptor [Kordiimonadaceae bacterium]|nr:TonB-dependent receptor [Kordiimonadaceae bacterium]